MKKIWRLRRSTQKSIFLNSSPTIDILIDDDETFGSTLISIGSETSSLLLPAAVSKVKRKQKDATTAWK